MARVIDFQARRAQTGPRPLLDGFSIEVMPRTAAKIDRFSDILPAGTRVYIAHIDGTPIADMVSTARRIAAEGFEVMPHLPARSIPDRATLADWVARYQGEAGVEGALLLAGGRSRPAGAFHSSMQLMETGLFDRGGFRRLHVAGHPEGNPDIAPDGREAALMAALRWKQEFAQLSDLDMAIVTQFVFDARPMVEWAARLRAEGIRLPIHAGVAGPAKLQTLIRYALSCGVGPSVRVLQRRAADVTRLMRPFAPDEVLADLAAARAADPEFQLERVHLFPLGGIDKAAEYAGARTTAARAFATG
jgi:methylenetetrahydrofolate reductase (NADPH)